MQSAPTTTLTQTVPSTTVRSRPTIPDPSPIKNPVIAVSRFSDFELTIPGDWLLLTPTVEELSSLGSGLGASLPGISGSALVQDAGAITEFTALWAQSGDLDGFRENIQVLRMIRLEGLDLSTLSEAAIADVSSLGLVNLSKSETKIGGLVAIRLTSQTPPGPTAPVFQSSVFLLGADFVWIINFATDDPTTLSLFEAMLATFQLLIPSN
ncbi:MAG: hypothetical protein JJE47_12460 [Acidimicrobiia bacterium]|nr:hypothetical protein [Acidimicrobiia bacterium]